MKSLSSVPVFIKQIVFMMLFVTVTSCATEDKFLEPEVSQAQLPAIPEDQAPAEVPNFTVSGSYTEFTEESDCSSCSYVVPADMKIVDGKELGIKAGSKICLQKNTEYASLEFVNIEGTFEKPITISYCGE